MYQIGICPDNRVLSGVWFGGIYVKSASGWVRSLCWGGILRRVMPAGLRSCYCYLLGDRGGLVGVEPVAGDAGGGGQWDFASEGTFHATLYYLLKF